MRPRRRWAVPGWQLLEEHIDSEAPFTADSMSDVDRLTQTVWGIRHIDDAIVRRQNNNYAGGADTDYSDVSNPSDRAGDYVLHDHQYSTVALISSSAGLVERIDYDSYGEARHHWSKDVNGDGAVSGLDRLWGTLPKMIYQSGYNADADLDRNGSMNSTDLAQIQSPDYQAALPPGMMTDMTSGGADNVIGYGGYVFNGESYLYTVRHRHYDPSSSGGGGRWLERDARKWFDWQAIENRMTSMGDESPRSVRRDGCGP